MKSVHFLEKLLKIFFLKYIFKKFLPPNICDPNFFPPNIYDKSTPLRVVRPWSRTASMLHPDEERTTQGKPFATVEVFIFPAVAEHQVSSPTKRIRERLLKWFVIGLFALELLHT